MSSQIRKPGKNIQPPCARCSQPASDGLLQSANDNFNSCGTLSNPKLNNLSLFFSDPASSPDTTQSPITSPTPFPLLLQAPPSDTLLYLPFIATSSDEIVGESVSAATFFITPRLIVADMRLFVTGPGLEVTLFLSLPTALGTSIPLSDVVFGTMVNKVDCVSGGNVQPTVVTIPNTTVKGAQFNNVSVNFSNGECQLIRFTIQFAPI
jgi:hypothetical protein